MALPRLRRDPSEQALRDAGDAVWPGAQLRITRSTRPGDGEHDHVVLPSVGRPRWILPAEAGVTAAALVNHQTGRLAGAPARVIATAHRAGVLRRIPLRRLRVGPASTESLGQALAHVLGDEVAVAIRLGSWQETRSLVVRAFGPDGRTRAFGKVGIDPRGRADVVAEHAALTRVAGLSLAHVVHPQVLYHGQWRGMEVLLVTPLLHGRRPDSPDELPGRAMLELARAGGSRLGTLATSAWWSHVRARLAGVEDRAFRAPLEDAATRLERRAGAVDVPLGSWHGDWTPWNMACEGATVLLWDWEHFADDVPLGFDHLHFLAQHLRVSSGAGAASERAWRAHATAALAGLGLTQIQQDAVVVAYLLEVNLRFVLDRQSTAEATRRRTGWGLELLRQEAGRLGRPS